MSTDLWDTVRYGPAGENVSYFLSLAQHMYILSHLQPKNIMAIRPDVYTTSGGLGGLVFSQLYSWLRDAAETPVITPLDSPCVCPAAPDLDWASVLGFLRAESAPALPFLLLCTVLLLWKGLREGLSGLSVSCILHFPQGAPSLRTPSSKSARVAGYP